CFESRRPEVRALLALGDGCWLESGASHDLRAVCGGGEGKPGRVIPGAEHPPARQRKLKFPGGLADDNGTACMSWNPFKKQSKGAPQAAVLESPVVREPIADKVPARGRLYAW